mmetsp:Transcript_5765/g.16504  ORF Transcript_5765/g.16504 Transcript_5765/m.16504 type:complete len:237 (+) Transcript_5765:289-999(+)
MDPSEPWELREVQEAVRKRRNISKQRLPVVAKISVFSHDEHVLEEGIDGAHQLLHRLKKGPDRPLPVDLGCSGLICLVQCRLLGQLKQVGANLPLRIHLLVAPDADRACHGGQNSLERCLPFRLLEVAHGGGGEGGVVAALLQHGAHDLGGATPLTQHHLQPLPHKFQHLSLHASICGDGLQLCSSCNCRLQIQLNLAGYERLKHAICHPSHSEGVGRCCGGAVCRKQAYQAVQSV